MTTGDMLCTRCGESCPIGQEFHACRPSSALASIGEALDAAPVPEKGWVTGSRDDLVGAGLAAVAKAVGMRMVRHNDGTITMLPEKEGELWWVLDLLDERIEKVYQAGLKETSPAMVVAMDELVGLRHDLVNQLLKDGSNGQR
jgi:hypothetical protein